MDNPFTHVGPSPHPQVKLMVLTNRCLKVFDLSVDPFTPCLCLAAPSDTLQDAIIVAQPDRHLAALVLTQQVRLHRASLTLASNGDLIICLGLYGLVWCYLPLHPGGTAEVSLCGQRPTLSKTNPSCCLCIVSRIVRRVMRWVMMSNR